MTDYTIGILILAASMAAIVLMLAIHYKLIADFAIEEAREAARQDARRMAERRYRQMLHDTRFRIQQQICITDETEVKP